MRRITQTAAAGAASLLAGFLACREPTQITLIVRTDAGCPTDAEAKPRLNDVFILSAKKVSLHDGDELVPNANTSQCGVEGSANLVGSLVLLPSGDDPSVEVLVVAGVDRGDEVEGTTTSMSSGACAALLSTPGGSIEGKPCIVARRRLTFVDHNSLVLPVDLDTRCIGEDCGSDLTCYQGNCVSPDVACGDSGQGCPEVAGCDVDCDVGCDGFSSCIDGQCQCDPSGGGGGQGGGGNGGGGGGDGGNGGGGTGGSVTDGGGGAGGSIGNGGNGSGGGGNGSGGGGSGSGGGGNGSGGGGGGNPCGSVEVLDCADCDTICEMTPGCTGGPCTIGGLFAPRDLSDGVFAPGDNCLCVEI